MILERAIEIVRAINARAFIAMGLKTDDVLSLDGVGLRQMLEAVALIEAENDRLAEESRLNGGGHTIRVVPAERLIAAVYTLEHYAPESDVLAARSDGQAMRVVTVVAMKSLGGEGEA